MNGQIGAMTTETQFSRRSDKGLHQYTTKRSIQPSGLRHRVVLL